MVKGACGLSGGYRESCPMISGGKIVWWTHTHTHTHAFRVFFWRGLPLPLPSSPGRSPTGVRLPPCDLGRSPRRDHGAYQVTWRARSPTPKGNPKILFILGTGSHSPYQVSLIGVPLANASHLATPNTPPEGIVARTGS